MAIVKGTVDKINGKKFGNGTAWAFVVDDEWYRMGFNKPKFKEGYQIQFDDEHINEYQQIDIDTIKFKKGKPKKNTSSASDVAKGGSSENWEARAQYWANKDERDIVNDGRYSYRSAYHAAKDLIDKGLEMELLQLATPKASKPKKWAAYLTMISQLASDLHPEFMAAGAAVEATDEPVEVEDEGTDDAVADDLSDDDWDTNSSDDEDDDWED